MEIKIKALSIKEYLNKIRAYLTLYVHIFHVVLEKLFFGFFVCMEVAKQNLIEKLEKMFFPGNIICITGYTFFPKRL